MRAAKAIRLLTLLPRRPVEFYDRVMTVLELRSDNHRLKLPKRSTVSIAEALRIALNITADQVNDILAERWLREIEHEVLTAIVKETESGPFDVNHNGDFSLARAIYVICRVMSPDVVLETGVAYGVSSAFALQALSVNHKGHLFSVDLPPLGANADQNVGALIPAELKQRWRLHRGNVRRVLPQVINAIGQVDVFVHDSLHTYRNMTFEFQCVWPSLRRSGAIVADDVELNEAFHDFGAQKRIANSVLVREDHKNAQFGILVKPR